MPLANGVAMQTGNANAVVVIFYPPAPATLLSQNGSTFLSPPATSNVYLTIPGGSLSTMISINPAGQVNW